MSFFDRLRGQGKLHREGEFTLDVEQAGSKLSRFQFKDDRDFLYHLVGGLFRLGAEGVEVEWKANRLTLRMHDLPLEPDFLPGLPGALLDEHSPQRRLAAATQSLLVHKLVRFDWIGSGKNQLYDYLSAKEQNWEQVKLREIQLEGLPSGLVDRALGQLSKKSIYSRKSLLIGGCPMPIMSPTGQLGGLPATCQCRPGQPGQLELVVDEMVCPPKPVAAPFPWHGVCYGDFRLDVSLSSVVEDETYALATSGIESTFAACIEKVSDREILGKLLSGPGYAWLQPLIPRLRDMPLFTDQRGRPWSISQLAAQNEPVYFCGERAPVDLPETILQETSTAMRACLQAQLGYKCQQAGDVIFRQLRRKLNHHEWSQRPESGLTLSQRNWLARKTYEQTAGKWLLGIPDDWASPGGSVALLHQGRLLCTRKLVHPEVAFSLVCEIAEPQINELWDDISERAWQELEPRWLHSLEELVREMAGENAPQGALRTYLVEHLGRSQRPQDSYFAKTLLFQDWHGQLYSLFQLLALEPGQTLCLVALDQKPLEDFVPEGIFIKSGSWEKRLFQKISSLKVLELHYLLEDLKFCRRQNFQERRQLLPSFGQGQINFCVRGIQLETLRIDSVLSFEAWVQADELQFQIRLENEFLGQGRFRPSANAKSRRLLEALLAEVRQLPAPAPLKGEWLGWAREASLRGMAGPELACWPTLRHGLVSLLNLQKAERVHWTSGPGTSQFGQELLLINLSAAQQTYLESQCGNEWVGQDHWFAEQERLRVFLQGPVWKPDFRPLASYPGVWLVSDKGPGRLISLFRGRRLREEEGVVPPGVRATLECEGLSDYGDLAELKARVSARIAEWLAVARPSDRAMMVHWREWEGLDQEIHRLLRRQPWFHTSQGDLSWEDIVEKGEVFRVVALHPGLDKVRLFVADSGTPPGLLDSLFSQHARGHSVAQTDRLLQEEKKLAGQRQRLEEQSRRLKGLKFKIRTEWGEVGLSGRAAKDCWLLLSDRALLIHNLPPGLVGALQCEEHRLRRIGGKEHAELNQGLRRKFYDALEPLLQQRIQAGRLNAAELDTFCEYFMVSPDKLAGVRWIPCADGSLTSLAQLKMESKEREELGYWPKAYAFSTGGARITPILSSPLLREVVGRHCGYAPTQLPKPLLYQDVKLPSFRNVGQVLRSLGNAADKFREQVVQLETRRASLFETLFKKSPPPPEVKTRATGEEGRALLTALRRQAAQLTQGSARKEVMKVLERAQIGSCRGLWEFGSELVLSKTALKAYLGDKEPPIEVTLSLLLSLVSAINARSQPFTDEMEEKFLGSLTGELVGSWATSGNAGSSEVTRS